MAGELEKKTSSPQEPAHLLLQEQPVLRHPLLPRKPNPFLTQPSQYPPEKYQCFGTKAFLRLGYGYLVQKSDILQFDSCLPVLIGMNNMFTLGLGDGPHPLVPFPRQKTLAPLLMARTLRT